jgi:PHD/YefM family antitoxin component YafN of YafNO toxin-antitoxin module
MVTPLQLNHETQSVAAFRDHLPEFLDHLRHSPDPITLTVDGRPEIVLQEASAYQRLLDLAATADASEGIRQGLEEMRHGESRSAEDFLNEMRLKYAIPR